MGFPRDGWAVGLPGPEPEVDQDRRDGLWLFMDR